MDKPLLHLLTLYTILFVGWLVAREMRKSETVISEDNTPQSWPRYSPNQ